MPALIQYIPGTTLFHRLDPRNKLALALTFLIMAFLLNQIWQLMIVFICALLLWWLVKAPFDLVRSLLIILMVFAVFIILIQGLFWPGEPSTPFIDLVPGFMRAGAIENILGSADDPERSLVLAKEGVLFGVLLVFRLGIILSIMPIIALITPIKDLALGLEKMGLPPQIAYLVMTTFRFIPLLTQQTATILDAQKLRGLEVEKANIIRRITAYAPLAVPVILGAFRSSHQLEMVLECRGFSSAKNRTSLYEVEWKKLDNFFFAGLVGLIVVGVIARIMF